MEAIDGVGQFSTVIEKIRRDSFKVCLDIISPKEVQETGSDYRIYNHFIELVFRWNESPQINFIKQISGVTSARGEKL